MKIAIIGWGSLIWNPKDLDVASEWFTDGPLLPVEFARVSSGDRLTLVLVDGVPDQPTLWALSKKATLEDVAADLAVRERCAMQGIGSWPRIQGASSVGRHDEVIRAWVKSKHLDGAVWTALRPKGQNNEKVAVCEEVRLEYLRGLVASGRDADAKQYFEKAPVQIATPFRALVKRELGWG